MMRSLAVLAVAVTLALAASAPGDDWPQFRGPTGQGLVAQGRLPVEWGPNKNVLWKQGIPGKGWSSPIIYQGRIYLTTAVPLGKAEESDQSLRALCLDAGKGKILWDKEVFRQDGDKAPPIHAKNSHASPSPVTDGKRLYVHFGHQGTACLDLKGKILWKNNRINYQPVHGNGGTPVLAGKALVFSCDGGDQRHVVALDRQSGKVLWKKKRSVAASLGFSFSTPLLITVKGRQQLVSPGSGMVGAYDPKTGEELWRVRYPGGYSVIPRPVYGQGLVFVCTGYTRPTLLAIRPDGKGDVTKTHVAWKTNKAMPHAPSPLLVGKELYTVSDAGVASCLDAKTGKVHWQKRLGGGYSASPIAADGKVYFLSEDGTGVVVMAGKEFKQLAKNVLGERTLSSYAAAGGALYIRTAKHLYKIGSQ
jgi:outer membrane protein assembly factor BamB